MTAGMITLRQGSFETKFSIMSYALGVFSIVLLLGLFALSLKILTPSYRYKIREDKKFRQRFGSLWKDKDLDFASLGYQPLFFLQRIVIAFVLVYMDY
jgi:hypothetical protein